MSFNSNAQLVVGVRYCDLAVMHLHVHIVPRRENDNIVLPWTNQEK
jgi:diadenosine tetraphosphate (Ap4A) HIT family hydrolase